MIVAPLGGLVVTFVLSPMILGNGPLGFGADRRPDEPVVTIPLGEVFETAAAPSVASGSVDITPTPAVPGLPLRIELILEDSSDVPTGVTILIDELRVAGIAERGPDGRLVVTGRVPFGVDPGPASLALTWDGIDPLPIDPLMVTEPPRDEQRAGAQQQVDDASDGDATLELPPEPAGGGPTETPATTTVIAPEVAPVPPQVGGLRVFPLIATTVAGVTLAALLTAGVVFVANRRREDGQQSHEPVAPPMGTTYEAVELVEDLRPWRDGSTEESTLGIFHTLMDAKEAARRARRSHLARAESQTWWIVRRGDGDVWMVHASLDREFDIDPRTGALTRSSD